MKKSIFAGIIYFSLVFTVAFGIGALRVTFIEPIVGKLWAITIELPFMILTSLIVCRWLVRVFDRRTLNQTISMGTVAFILLIGAEFTGSIILFNRSLQDQLATFHTAAGVLGLAGQVTFALLPLAIYLHNLK
jgi:hypothetical protein